VCGVRACNRNVAQGKLFLTHFRNVTPLVCNGDSRIPLIMWHALHVVVKQRTNSIHMMKDNAASQPDDTDGTRQASQAGSIETGGIALSSQQPQFVCYHYNRQWCSCTTLHCSVMIQRQP